MTIKLAINGFGRIGRNVLRALMESGRRDLEVVAVNDLAPLETCAHLFEYDSVHGRYGTPVTVGPDTHDVGRGPIRLTRESDPAKLPWSDVDIALECTGHFRTRDGALRHLKNGSNRVLISAPSQDTVKTVVFGVNHRSITATDTVISNASCTSNCLIPVAHVLHQSFGIQRGHMTTVHCYTGNQSLHDKDHPDLYRARAAGLSMVPTNSGSAEALGLVLPELKDRITSTAVRVPTPNVSCIDLVVETRAHTTPDEINTAMRAAAAGPLRGILSITDRILVSIDLNHDAASAILATDQTAVQQGTLVRVLAWYDNEWAFANRMLDTVGVMAQTR